MASYIKAWCFPCNNITWNSIILVKIYIHVIINHIWQDPIFWHLAWRILVYCIGLLSFHVDNLGRVPVQMLSKLLLEKDILLQIYSYIPWIQEIFSPFVTGINYFLFLKCTRFLSFRLTYRFKYILNYRIFVQTGNFYGIATKMCLWTWGFNYHKDG